MFLKESMRLYPPVVAAGRQLEHPMKIKTDINSTTETTLPTGSRLLLSIIALHRNPLIWENSEVGVDSSIDQAANSALTEIIQKFCGDTHYNNYNLTA